MEVRACKNNNDSHSICAVQGSVQRHKTKKINHNYLILDRPGLNGHYSSPNRHVFFNVDWSIDHMVPHRWIVCTVHNIDLDFHGTGQRRISFVLCHGLQLVSFSLNSKTGPGKRKTEKNKGKSHAFNKTKWILIC